MASIKLTGVKEALARLRRIQLVTPAALAAALEIEAELIMTESKTRFVPVDTGTLKSSGRVEAPEIRKNEVSVTLGYGGAASAYALAIHEHPSGHSPPSWSGGMTIRGQGGTKFLERPVRNAAPRVGLSIARRLKRSWRR